MPHCLHHFDSLCQLAVVLPEIKLPSLLPRKSQTPFKKHPHRASPAAFATQANVKIVVSVMPTPEVSPEVRALQHEFALLREQIREEFLDIAERLKALETSKLELSGGLRHRPPAPEDTKNTEKKEKLEDDLELQLGSEVDLGTQVGPVHFGESAWTFPVILGLTSASALEVVFAVLLLLINLGMQVMFAEVILGPSFMGSPFEEEVDTARRWRAGIAHDYKYMDLQQTSLATRVCSADGALILSTVQAGS